MIAAAVLRSPRAHAPQRDHRAPRGRRRASGRFGRNLIVIVLVVAVLAFGIGGLLAAIFKLVADRSPAASTSPPPPCSAWC